jgi:hypothetical protein
MGVYLTGVHLMGVHLMGVYLTGVHVTGVHLVNVHLIGVYLMGVYLTGVHLMGVYLMGVHLTGVHLMGVYLTGVHLMGVYLTGVHLMGMYLTGVHLTGVYLMDVHLIGMYFMGVHLIDVYFIDVYMFNGADPPPYEGWSICREVSCKIGVFALVAGLSPICPGAVVRLKSPDSEADSDAGQDVNQVMLEGNVTSKAKRATFGGVLIRPRWIDKGKKDGQDARMNYGERIAATSMRLLKLVHDHVGKPWRRRILRPCGAQCHAARPSIPVTSYEYLRRDRP